MSHPDIRRGEVQFVSFYQETYTHAMTPTCFFRLKLDNPSFPATILHMELNFLSFFLASIFTMYAFSTAAIVACPACHGEEKQARLQERRPWAGSLPRAESARSLKGGAEHNPGGPVRRGIQNTVGRFFKYIP